MTEERYRQRVEPILFAIAILIPLIISIVLLAEEIIAPAPWSLSCTATFYPYFCDAGIFRHDDNENYAVCDAITFSSFGLALTWVVVIFFIIVTILIFSTMILICITVYSKNKRVERYIRQVHHRTDSEEVKKRQAETKVIFIQSLLYLCACTLSQLLPFWAIFLRESSPGWQYFHIVFKPLQGLFNFAIFMGHQVYNRRRSNTSLTRWQAFCKTFTSPQEEASMFFDNIDLVSVEAGNDESQDNIVDPPRIRLAMTSRIQRDTNLDDESNNALSGGNDRSQRLEISNVSVENNASPHRSLFSRAFNAGRTNSQSNPSPQRSWFSRLSITGNSNIQSHDNPSPQRSWFSRLSITGNSNIQSQVEDLSYGISHEDETTK